MRKRTTQETARQFSVGVHTFNEYGTNLVQTSKYTKLNFVPKAIILQFNRLANIYFLITAVLQCIDVISSLSPFSAIAPFVLVIVISIIREAVEDLPRQKSDKKVNSSWTLVLDEEGKQFEDASWGDLRVGDIVLIKDEEEIPADLVLLRTSNENQLAFIETASLDGEKNLKPKYALQETAAYFQEKKLKNQKLFECEVYAQPPDPFIYRFEGAFSSHDQAKTPLSSKQFLLRGSRLKNVDWIIGAVVYTGKDTKIMRNSEKSKTKQSRVEAMMNRLILLILFVQMLFCAITAIGNRLWNGKNLEKHTYLPNEININLEAFYTFLSYFLLMNTMIPISLIVTIELVKFIQAIFIQRDEDMYNAKKDKGASVFCSSINEELGLVDYIFSDKTGTLTSNEMVFKNFVIGNQVYGEDHSKAPSPKIKNDVDKDVSEESLPVRQNVFDEDHTIDHNKLKNALSSTHTEIINFPVLNYDGQHSMTLRTQRDLASEFLQAVATCHECLAEVQKNGRIFYQGQSQDEIRLVETAHQVGFSYLGGSLEKISIRANQVEKQFKVLQSFEFNSDRKRMSILLRDGSDLKLYVKGADNIVLDRLNKNTDHPFLDSVNFKLDQFSKGGYRTLVYAMRIVTEDEYKDLREKLDDVATAPDREERVAQIANDFEKNLCLIGCTAVEDRLQDNVPKVIEDLLASDIKVWMLTGDKLETAENIAQSCRLITGDMNVMRCSAKSPENIKKKLKENKEIFDLCIKEERKKAFIIEGESLAYILPDEQLMELFTEIVIDCDAVICCRATPKQKAQMVRLVKDQTNKVTLAIGDGANDVNMIQAANIGIGIYGHEGVQAVQASDYSIPEFQGLWRLLLVHGRWSYLRISEMILYFFYKNMIFTLQQFFFAFLCGYSAMTIFDDYYVTGYNLVFTALPLSVKAILEKDADYKIRLPKRKITKYTASSENLEIKSVFPKLYAEDKSSLIFTYRSFAINMVKAVVMAVILFVIAIFQVEGSIIDDSGIPGSMWFTSITLYTAVFLTVTIKLASQTRYWNIIFIGCLVVLSLLIYFVFTLIYDTLTSFKASETVGMNYGSVVFYAYLVFFVGLELLLDFGSILVKKQFFPTLSDLLKVEIVKEAKKLGSFNDKYRTTILSKLPKSLFGGSQLDIPSLRDNKELSKTDKLEPAIIKNLEPKSPSEFHTLISPSTNKPSSKTNISSRGSISNHILLPTHHKTNSSQIPSHQSLSSQKPKPDWSKPQVAPSSETSLPSPGLTPRSETKPQEPEKQRPQKQQLQKPQLQPQPQPKPQTSVTSTQKPKQQQQLKEPQKHHLTATKKSPSPSPSPSHSRSSSPNKNHHHPSPSTQNRRREGASQTHKPTTQTQHRERSANSRSKTSPPKNHKSHSPHPNNRNMYTPNKTQKGR